MADRAHHTKESTDTPPDLPSNAVKLVLRIQSLPAGRYLLVITKKGKDVMDWSIMGDGAKVEVP